RRRRRAHPGAPGVAGLAAAVRAAGARAHLRARAGLGRLPAAGRLGRGRRLDRGAHLRHGARQHPVPALAFARLAEDSSVMDALIPLKTVAHSLLLPPGGLLLLAVLGAWLAMRARAAGSRRAGRLLLGAALALLWLLATPLLARFLERSVQSYPAL